MMPRIFRLLVPSLMLIPAALDWTSAPLLGQVSSGSEWSTYGGDLASRRYRPFDQIDRNNFNKLEIAWRFKTDGLGPRPEFNLQSTPLMVGGVLYTTRPGRVAPW